jgi:hypothetical protein
MNKPFADEAQRLLEDAALLSGADNKGRRLRKRLLDG